jgi:hypothetical protein
MMVTPPPPPDDSTLTQEELLLEEGLAMYLRLRRAWRAEFHSPTGNPETLESLTRQLAVLEESFPYLVKR